MSSFVALPPPSESSDLTFIVVKENGELAMGVAPVKPGGYVSFLDSGDSGALAITFQDNSSPFTTSTSLATNNQLQIDSSSSGDYYFGFTAGEPSEQRYPYRVAVTASGADTAKYHLVEDSGTTTLHVFQNTVRESGQTQVSVAFTKEGFNDEVYLEVMGSSEALYRLPLNQSAGVWVISFSSGLTESLNFTVNATLVDPTIFLGGHQEVIGSSAADLEIEPPP